MCPYLVSLPSYYEEQVLHHLPHFQLGSPYDVYTYDVCDQLLLPFSSCNVRGRICGMGAVRAYFPRTILGVFQFLAQMLGMYR
jgi:hypothetical protein